MAAQPSREDLQARLDAFVARVRTETGVPGIGLGVSVAGRRWYACAGVVVAGSSRPMTREARVQLGCAGKLLLALAALELDRRGIVATDSTIGQFLPELRGSLHGDAVRVAHLLSHTSGYRGTNVLDPRTQSLTWAGFVAYLRAAPQLFAPGSVFSYEHTETVLLGEILRRVTRKSCSELVNDAILRPLGIRGSTAATATADPIVAGRHRFDEATNSFIACDDAPLSPFWHAAFSAETVSPADLLAIGEAVIGRTHGDRPPIVPETTRRRLLGTVVRLPATAGGPLRELMPVAFGLGAAELRDGSYGNTGVSAGQCLGLRFDERSGVSVAVVMNAMVPYLRDFVLTTVVRDLTGRAPADDREPFEPDLANLEGAYAGPGGGRVDVRYEGGRLICTIGRENAREQLRVELALDDDGRPVLRSPLPHLALGFFRVADGNLGLMIGLGAYKRLSTNRPFQR